ncbi:hypothetical protein KAR28_05300 [Candidatus Parcubacteria bacterium]|nr:hypothetical protein [Candidatus Parcubacteria bacterium]
MKFFISLLLIILILLISGGLYWFGWRPEQIRRECYVYAREEAEKQIKKFYGTNVYNIASGLGEEVILEESLGPIYNSCLRARGINK